MGSGDASADCRTLAETSVSARVRSPSSLAAGSLIEEGEGRIGSAGIDSGGEETLRCLRGNGRNDHVFLTDFAHLQVHPSIHVATDIAAVETEQAILADRKSV